MHTPERHIYFSSGLDEVANLFLDKFHEFSSKYISSTIVHSESQDGLNTEEVQILHDDNLPKSFYQNIFEKILTSKPQINIDFYIDVKLNTSCSIYLFGNSINDLYMTEFFNEPNFLNLISYQVHKLQKIDLFQINDFWLYDT